LGQPDGRLEIGEKFPFAEKIFPMVCLAFKLDAN